MKERRQYKTPPIQEALVEFRFDGSDSSSDVTVIGELYARLKERYPNKRVRHAVEHGVEVGPDGPVPLPPRAGIDRVQFLSRDELDLVAVGMNVLSIHRLRPYAKWEALSQNVAEALTLYGEVAGKPSVTRIGVRYINKLDCPNGLDSLKELLTLPIGLPAGLPDDLEKFLFRFESRYDDRRRLLLTLARDPEHPDEVVVDFDVIFRPPAGAPLDFAAAPEEAEHLRDLERDAFEALITNTAREVFDA